jgi:diguanylate cyclase (GGDEF)-like protein
MVPMGFRPEGRTMGYRLAGSSGQQLRPMGHVARVVANLALAVVVISAAFRRPGPPSSVVAVAVALYLGYRVMHAVSERRSRLELLDRLRHEVAEKEHQALHDPLTGLANRELFARWVDEALGTASTTGGDLAVMVMNLRRFKEVNDTLGHHSGDVILREVGSRLLGAVPGTRIARLGSDEFAACFEPANGVTGALEQATALQVTLETPIHLGDVTIDVAANIGVAVGPEHGADGTTLLRRADAAMHAARTAHRSCQMYSGELDQSPLRLSLAGELRSAASRGELTVEYQPIAEISDGRLVAMEALVRWDHPKHGRLEPDQFIPLAEQTGAITSITNTVIKDALDHCRQWRDQGHTLRVSVNLSARSLGEPDLPERVGQMLAAAGVAPDNLILEITESTIMSDPGRMIDMLTQLTTLGVRLAIDDFGTGYSSFAYLQQLPVHEVKIDKSFVIGMAQAEGDAMIVRSIVDLGLNLGLAVVAEGVEDSSALELLQAFGCSSAQGYYVGRPMPAEQITAGLASGRFVAERATSLILSGQPTPCAPGPAAAWRRRLCASHAVTPAAAPAVARR